MRRHTIEWDAKCFAEQQTKAQTRDAATADGANDVDACDIMIVAMLIAHGDDSGAKEVTLTLERFLCDV